MKYVTTTEDLKFALVNAEESWHLVAGPRPIVEQLLGCTLDEAWANFGTQDAPFLDMELEGIRSHLRLYKDFF